MYSRGRKARVAVSGDGRRSGEAEVKRESPVPSWMPLMTQEGMRSVRARRRPVRERRRRAAETRKPASWGVEGGRLGEARVAAAMACHCPCSVLVVIQSTQIDGRAMLGMYNTFIGCTGKGTPKTAPVTRLNTPDVTSIAGKSMEPCRESARVRGMKVPRSPRAPAISAAGERRRVSRLRRLTARRLESAVIAITGWLMSFHHQTIFATK